MNIQTLFTCILLSSAELSVLVTHVGDIDVRILIVIRQNTLPLTNED